MAGKKDKENKDIAVMLARRYGIKSEGREGPRYSTPEEIMEKPGAWEGDVSDLEEPEAEEPTEEEVPAKEKAPPKKQTAEK